jgi:hypothetical protein
MAYAEAERGMLVSVGGTSGKTTYTTSDPNFSFLNGQLDHSTSGSALAIAYAQVQDGGFMFGGGYHSYQVGGQQGTNTTPGTCVTSTGAKVPCTLTASLRTDELTISGMFGMVGYDLGFADTWSFRPQLRIGLGNTAKFSGTVTATINSSLGSSSAAAPVSASTSGTTAIIVLPVYVRFGKILAGLEYHSVGEQVTYTLGTDTIKASISSATMLSFGYLF